MCCGRLAQTSPGLLYRTRGVCVDDVMSHDRPSSWDGELSAPPADSPATPVDEALFAVKTRRPFDPAIRQLGRRDRDILRMLLFEGRTQADVSADLDIEQAEFSLLLRRILDDLHRSGDGDST